MIIQRDGRFTCHIVRFVDGDTLLVHTRCPRCAVLHEERVRLLGIDSFEPSGDTASRASHIASLASAHYRGMVGIFSVVAIRRDRYHRVLTDILINGVSLADDLVSRGWAWRGVGTTEPPGHVVGH